MHKICDYCSGDMKLHIRVLTCTSGTVVFIKFSFSAVTPFLTVLPGQDATFVVHRITSVGTVHLISSVTNRDPSNQRTKSTQPAVMKLTLMIALGQRGSLKHHFIPFVARKDVLQLLQSLHNEQFLTNLFVIYMYYQLSLCTL